MIAVDREWVDALSAHVRDERGQVLHVRLAALGRRQSIAKPGDERRRRPPPTLGLLQDRREGSSHRSIGRQITDVGKLGCCAAGDQVARQARREYTRTRPT